MKRKGKFFKSVKVFFSFVLLTTAVFCVFCRLPQCFESQNPAALAAANFTLSNGEYSLVTQEKEDFDNTANISEVKKNENTDEETEKKERDKSNYYDSYAEHEGELKYTVEERQIEGTGTQIENFYIKNKTGIDFDFEEYLNTELPFSVEKKVSLPQVLIYHTHTSEAYMDEDVDYFYESFYSRTQDTNFNVVGVGKIIADELNKKGIRTLHDTTVHDSSYNGSYDRSAQTVYANMEEYKDIKVVIDIHRDAIGTEENKVKPVFTYNGKKGAQIMILSGCDVDGVFGFDNWENNLNFALKLQKKAEEMYPGITRPLSFGNFAYNEYICDGSLLIEVGAEGNSIEEAEYTGKLLANVLYEVLK